MIVSPIFHAYRLSLLPLAVAWIIVATAIPFELRSAAQWEAEVKFTDVVNNLLLYVPLGIALERRLLPWIFICALALAVVLESAQLWSVGRFASPVDAIANVLGATIAALTLRQPGLRRGLDTCVQSTCRAWPAIAALGIASIQLLWSPQARWPDLRAWNPEFPLVLGNEAGGTFP